MVIVSGYCEKMVMVASRPQSEGGEGGEDPCREEGERNAGQREKQTHYSPPLAALST